MSKLTSLLGALALCGSLALAVAPAALNAYPKGLIRTADFSQIYWVDRFGMSHNVSDTGMIPVYFKNDFIKEVSWDEWMRIPKGGPIGASTPPEYYDTYSGRAVPMAAGLARTYDTETTTTYRNAPLVVVPAPQVRTVTTYGATPMASSQTVTTYGPNRFGEQRTTTTVERPRVQQQTVTTFTSGPGYSR